ncbi:unnamed protein product [Allacma fusca]|uniref:Uncharacterized protein n=1 Tax=Allacma fusca TaxID=39272 RepID=A0A8J2KTW2_9HEXA|nr:unnamed protein product [Allacma fusca]
MLHFDQLVGNIKNGSNFVKAFCEFGIDLADQVTGREGIVTGEIIDVDELDSVDDDEDDEVSELVSEDMGRVL